VSVTGHGVPIGCLGVLLASVAAGGQEGAPDADREAAQPSGLEERVEVRATLPADEDVAAFATTIDGEEIASTGEDLADLLRRVPGARVRDYGGLGSYATISVRASTAEQVTVLVDGLPQNRALGGPVDLSSIPATQIERVTVFRGFAPAGLGLGGIGGVVDVRTRAPAREPGGRVDVLAGELGTARLSTGWSLRTGSRGSVRFGGEALASRGDFTFLDTGATLFDPSDDAVRRRANNDLEQGALLAQGVWREIGPGDLRAAIRAQRRDRGVPGLDNLASESARLDETLTQLTGSWSWRREGALRGLDLVLDGFDERIELRDPEGDLGLVQDRATRLRGAALASIVRGALGRHRLQARIDLRREDARVRDAALEVSDRGGANRELLGVTAEELVVLGRFTLAPSARWDWRRDDFRAAGAGTLPPPARDVTESEWAGKLGLSWAAGRRTSLRGSVGRFYRSPNLTELFGDRGSVIGNPGLRSERGRAAEIGLARRWEGEPSAVDLEVVAFTREVEDLIQFLPQSQGTAVAQNVLAARVRGLEGYLALRLPRGIRLDASATLQRAEDDSGTIFDGEPLAYQPERLGYLGAELGRGPVLARWELTYVGPNNTTRLDQPELRLPSRVIHDLSIGHRWSNGLRLGIDVRNLFDRQVRDVARYPLPSRVMLVHLGWGARPGGEPHEARRTIRARPRSPGPVRRRLRPRLRAAPPRDDRSPARAARSDRRPRGRAPAPPDPGRHPARCGAGAAARDRGRGVR
jgi:iron complex outermembrane receptor protein